MSPNLMSPNLMLSCCDVEMLRCHVEMLRCHGVVGYHEIMVWECVISGCILWVYFCGVYLGYLCFLLHVIFAYFGIPWYFIWAPIEYHPLLVRVFCVVICACMFVSMYSFCYIPWKYRVLSTYLGMVYLGSIVVTFVTMVIMIMMIMMIAIPRSRDLGCHDVTMSRSRFHQFRTFRDFSKPWNFGVRSWNSLCTGFSGHLHFWHILGPFFVCHFFVVFCCVILWNRHTVFKGKTPYDVSKQGYVFLWCCFFWCWGLNDVWKPDQR